MGETVILGKHRGFWSVLPGEQSETQCSTAKQRLDLSGTKDFEDHVDEGLDTCRRERVLWFRSLVLAVGGGCCDGGSRREGYMVHSKRSTRVGSRKVELTTGDSEDRFRQAWHCTVLYKGI